MTQFVMIPLSAEEAAGRPAINTGLSMLGRGGNDFVCGHCGRVMITDFDVETAPADMVYVCGGCDGPNGVPHT